MVGDAGCIDGSIEILDEFPRVKVFDHKAVKTLGKSLALLIDEVRTPQFVYLQSDGALPPGWFNDMKKDLLKFDWIGSPMHLCVLADFRNDFRESRPLAGAQLGKTAAFDGLSNAIEDDYVYRQEDFVFSNYVIQKGFKVGNSDSTYHLHQFMRRKTLGEENVIQSIDVKINSSDEEKKRVDQTQMQGMLKYTSPNYPLARNEVKNLIRHTWSNNPKLIVTYLDFAKEFSPEWVPILKRAAVRAAASALKSKIKNTFPIIKISQIQFLIKLIFS